MRLRPIKWIQHEMRVCDYLIKFICVFVGDPYDPLERIQRLNARILVLEKELAMERRRRSIEQKGTPMGQPRKSLEDITPRRCRQIGENFAGTLRERNGYFTFKIWINWIEYFSVGKFAFARKSVFLRPPWNKQWNREEAIDRGWGHMHFFGCKCQLDGAAKNQTAFVAQTIGRLRFDFGNVETKTGNVRNRTVQIDWRSIDLRQYSRGCCPPSQSTKKIRYFKRKFKNC